MTWDTDATEPPPAGIDVWRHATEARCELAAKEVDGVLRARARNWIAQDATAELVAPGERVISLPMVPHPDEPKLWHVASYPLPPESPEGIWRLRVRFTRASGEVETAETTFVHGSTLWWHSNVERILPHDPPRRDADRVVRIAAARGESEAFQLAVETTTPLTDVDLTVAEAVHEMGSSRIDPSAFKIERIHAFRIETPGRNRIGQYPDALLPWRRCDIPAGARKLAWITLTVGDGV